MGRHRTPLRIAGPALGVVLALAVVSTAAAGQRSTTHGDRATSRALLAVEAGELDAVAVTHGGAWAVGYSGDVSDSKALTLHWNGSHWQHERSPSPPDTQLKGVATVSPTNVWAVGSSGTSPAPTKTVILHWTGKKWRQLPSIPGSLSAVAATSPTNAWAVGATNDGAALILHWNGREWRQTPSPAGMLSGVAATSATNAWAVGGTTSGTDTLVLHWNGETWQQTPSPSVGGDQGLASDLLGVEASPGRPVWAVGVGDRCGCGPGNPLVEQWNGTTWSQISTSEIQDSMNVSAAASISPTRGWAVGQSGSGDGPTNGVILKWNGSAWTLQPVPGLESEVGGLSGVAATSRSDAWAVGWESPVTVASANAAGQPGDPGTREILILHWNGSAWTPMTRLGPAQTPAAALATTTTTTVAPTTTTSSTTTTTVPPSTTTTPPSASAAGGPLLGSAAWGQALGQFGGISGFGVAAPTDISLGGVATSPHVDSISWSNWGAAEATGQGQALVANSGPASSWPLAPVTVVAFDLGSCSGGPPAYQEVEWYFPGQGQTFDPNSATNACTGD